MKAPDLGFDQMGVLGAQPIKPKSPDEFLERLTHADWDMLLDERNAYANGVLSWATTVSFESFDLARNLILDCEISRQARAWRARFPEDTTNMAIFRIQAALAMMATNLLGRRSDEDYRPFMGPNIPWNVAKICEALVQVRSHP